MDGSESSPCFSCGSSTGTIPNPPPEIPSFEPFQPQSVVRGIIAETEQRIVHLEEMDRRSLEVRQTVIRRLEEYRCFVFYQKSLVAPIRRLPTELLSEIFAIYVVDDKKPLASYVDNGV